MAEDKQMVLFGLFTDEQQQEFPEITKVNDPHFIDIKCGCTSKRYGDISGTLRVWHNGRLEVSCECYGPECRGDGLSVFEFVKHGGKPATRWKNEIWVRVRDGKKVKLYKTCLLKYYKQPFYTSNRGLAIHADRFVTCVRCSKPRRFSLRTRQGCRAHHDADNKPNWTCLDMGKACSDPEERPSRRSVRGCPNLLTCGGCEKCVCIGCNMCRFRDCTCTICVEYWRNQI